jgi:hypothetical protein
MPREIVDTTTFEGNNIKIICDTDTNDLLVEILDNPDPEINCVYNTGMKDYPPYLLATRFAWIWLRTEGAKILGL